VARREFLFYKISRFFTKILNFLYFRKLCSRINPSLKFKLNPRLDELADFNGGIFSFVGLFTHLKSLSLLA